MAVTDVIIGDATNLVASDTSSTSAAPRASDFDVRDLETRGRAKVIKWLVEQPWFWAALRTFKPIVVIPGKPAIVTRYDHVQDVLRRDDVFHVPFGPKVSRLNGGPNFLLGMQAGNDYRRYQAQVMQAFRRDDAANIIAPLAAQLSNAIISSARGGLDAVEDLITRVPILICEAYYGVPVPNKVAFGHWTIAMSTYAFGDPGDDPNYRRAAEAGGRLVREVVDRAILDAKNAAPTDTVLGRLLSMQKNGAEGLSDEVIRSYLIGLITGSFPPTRWRPGTCSRCCSVAPISWLRPGRRRSPAMTTCLNGACSRRCGSCHSIPGHGGCAAGIIRLPRDVAGQDHQKGTTLLAGTQSAMFDSRNASSIRASSIRAGRRRTTCCSAMDCIVHRRLHRPAQITQTFKALLVKPDCGAPPASPASCS